MSMPKWCARCHRRAMINMDGSDYCGPCCNKVGGETGTIRGFAPQRTKKNPCGMSDAEVAEVTAYMESVKPQ